MLLHSLKIANLLSFGPDSEEIPLRKLNIIIGANGSGKSNFLEAISLLQAAPKDLTKPVREAGGIQEWLWKPGGKGINASVEAIVRAPLRNSHQERTMHLRHHLSFRESGDRFDIIEERIENEKPYGNNTIPYIYYHFVDGRAVLNMAGDDKPRELRRETVHPEQSVLSQRKDSDIYPEITKLGEEYSAIKLYREWSIGRYTPPRLSQDSAGRNTNLEENVTNLGLVLNGLRKNMSAKSMLLDYLGRLNSDIKDFDVAVENGKVQVFLQEQSIFIPATRLSDGTLRFVTLLAILCHPQPPSLVCIEEPELALHPDILPILGLLIKEASSRMQLIITTHSDILLDAFTDTPEDVIVCDKENMQTRMQRLNKKELADWLKDYQLGGGWIKGKIGGTRW
ncbi:MAG: AAA family ATPase [Magnetococcales bacterium]|nr:AAA family ATPase [Magnetococcales bacterium]